MNSIQKMIDDMKSQFSYGERSHLDSELYTIRKRLTYLKARFQRVRTSNLSISLIENLRIAEQVPLSHRASIRKLNGNQLKVTVFNPMDFQIIKQRLHGSDLTCHITEWNKKELTLSFQPMTTEARMEESDKIKNTTKVVHNEIRSAYQRLKKGLKKSYERKEITQDQYYSFQVNIKQIYDFYTAEVNELLVSVLKRINKI